MTTHDENIDDSPLGSWSDIHTSSSTIQLDHSADGDLVDRYIDVLLEDQKLHDLMMSGDFEGFQRRLTKFTDRAGNRQQEAAVDYVRSHPSGFADSAQDAPSLWTVKGIGTHLYNFGQHDNKTGYNLGTIWVTFIWLPLVPLSRYLVHEEPGGYRLLGRISLSTFHIWYRRIALALLGILAAQIAYAMLFKHPSSKPIDDAIIGDRSAGFSLLVLPDQRPRRRSSVE